MVVVVVAVAVAVAVAVHVFNKMFALSTHKCEGHPSGQRTNAPAGELVLQDVGQHQCVRPPSVQVLSSVRQPLVEGHHCRAAPTTSRRK